MYIKENYGQKLYTKNIVFVAGSNQNKSIKIFLNCYYSAVIVLSLLSLITVFVLFT